MHAMLAGIVAAAQGRKADVAALARAGDAVARALALGREIDLAPFGGGLAQRERRARGRIDLVAMMHLENLDVVIIAEALRRLLDQTRAAS